MKLKKLVQSYATSDLYNVFVLNGESVPIVDLGWLP